MSDLLKLAVNGHGGMHRWERISRFRAADDQRADVRSQERADDLLPPAEPDPLAIYQNALRRHQFLGGGSHSCISTRKYPPGTASAPAGSATGSPGSPYRSSNYGRNHLNPASRAIPRIGGSGGARCGGMRKSTRGLGDDGVPAARRWLGRVATYLTYSYVYATEREASQDCHAYRACRSARRGSSCPPSGVSSGNREAGRRLFQ